ncbi:hypothetical protein [uncultured Mediterranean phage]|nr:hypothetical protein [uncultured Mediterranean phage]
MKDFYVNHKQDFYDATQEIERLPFPFRIMAMAQRPTKGDSADKWKRQNSFFHRGIVPTYSSLSGLGEDEAKSFLQVRFACVAELEDSYDVESVSGMSLSRLAKFIEDCQNFLIANFGERADELLTENKLKHTKIKKIKK